MIDPLAAAEAALEADHAYDDPALWITRLPDEQVRAQARKLADEGAHGRPLWGLTFAVKDNIDVAGLPTTAACPDFAYVAAESAPCVQRLLEAGAVLLGKTNLDQFATGLCGVRSPYGTPRNPFDASRVPGGSSSGSAVAVAAGIVTFALGTDTAGSGRVPAAFGNIVGLKPTIGSISARGVLPACRSAETVSIFARSVDEALVVTSVLAGHDDSDPYSRIAPFGHLHRAASAKHASVAAADPADICTSAIARLYDRAASELATSRIDVTPLIAAGRLLYDGPWIAERTAVLRRVLEERSAILHPVTRAILEQGFDRKAADAFDAFHRIAEARRWVAQLFRRHEALLLPTAPFCPTLAELAADPLGPNARLGTFTNFVNLCDLAAIAVPIGLDPDGLPVGITVLGPAWSEGRLAAIADTLHRRFVRTVGATAAPLPPPVLADLPGADETALFCLGAHMSGLPLNHQLRDLGGRFLRIAHTQRAYRLYALGNRPGLVRGGAGVIEGEVWVLPTTAIGTLLAGVPPGLGFGTVQLSDGPCLGFLAETAAVAEAPEITRHGGWRAWLAQEGNK